MKKLMVGLSLLLSISLLPAHSATPPKAGTICSKKGITATNKGKNFKCVNKGGKLIWKVDKKKTAMPTTSPSQSTQNSWEPCGDGVFITDLSSPTQVVRGQNLEIVVSANSKCAIDALSVDVLPIVNGEAINNFGGWARQISGTKYSGTWSYALGISDKTPEVKMNIVLGFASCVNESSGPCSIRRSPFDNYETCERFIEFRACKVSRQVQILAPVTSVQLPNINTAILAGVLYCGINSSESWDYKQDYKKTNIISVLSWIFPNGEKAVWDRKSENWGEGTLQTGERYRISSNIEYWGSKGGLPTLKLSLFNTNGEPIRFDSTAFKGKTFVCKFESSINGFTVKTEGKLLIP